MDIILSLWWIPVFGFLGIMLYQFNSKNTKLQKKYDDEHRQMINMQADATVLRNRAKELELLIGKNESELEKLHIEFNEEHQLRTDYKASIEQFKSRIAHIQQTMNIQNNDLIEQKLKVVELQKQLTQEKSLHRESGGSEETVELRAKIQSLEAFINEQKDAFGIIQINRTSYETTIQQLRDDIQKKDEDIQRSVAELQRRDFELASAFSTAGLSEFDLRLTIGKMEADVVSYRTEIETLQKQLSKKTETHSATTESGEPSREDDKSIIAELRESLNEHQDVLQQLFDQLNVEVGKQKESEKAYNDMEQRLLGLIRELEQKNKSLEQQLVEKNIRIPRADSNTSISE
jgi:chromosome segregation ATPase